MFARMIIRLGQLKVELECRSEGLERSVRTRKEGEVELVTLSEIGNSFALLGLDRSEVHNVASPSVAAACWPSSCAHYV
jgi:hypothetical protein